MEFKIHSIILYSCLIFILFIIQSFQIISFGSIYPDFFLIITCIYALSRGSFKGEIFGFILGFLLDLMSGALFGLNAFVFTLIGALTSPFQKIAQLPNLIVFICYLIICTIIKYILYHIFFTIYQDSSLFDFYFFLKIPGEMLVNIVFGIVLYIFCARFDIRDDYEWFQ